MGMDRTAGTFVTGGTVVAQVGIAQTQSGFQVPVSTQVPLIAIGKTYTCAVAFVPVGLHIRQGQQRQVYTAHVVTAKEGMNTQEMTVELLIHPETKLGTYQPVLQLAQFVTCVETPGMITAANIQGKPGGQRKLHPQVDSGSGPVENIALHTQLLGG